MNVVVHMDSDGQYFAALASLSKDAAESGEANMLTLRRVEQEGILQSVDKYWSNDPEIIEAYEQAGIEAYSFDESQFDEPTVEEVLADAANDSNPSV